jgi:hypothetical protein
MPALSHIGLGLAAKRVVPQISIIVSVLAPLALDILAGFFWLAGIAHIIPPDFDPLSWSHGLFMSMLWSVSAALIAGFVYRNLRISLVIGLLAFSHWVLDFMMWRIVELDSVRNLPSQRS